MKINEIEKEVVDIILVTQSDQYQLSAKIIEKSDNENDEVHYIKTDVLRAENGAKIDLSSIYKFYVQIPHDKKAMRFICKHKRVKEESGEVDIFASSLDGIELEQRKAYRLPLGYHCEVKTAKEKFSANLKDLSITGLCTLGMSLELKVGEKVQVRFNDTLPGKLSIDEPIEVELAFSGFVVRERKAGVYNEYGIQITACDSNLLLKYIQTKQRELLKRDKERN